LTRRAGFQRVQLSHERSELMYNGKEEQG